MGEPTTIDIAHSLGKEEAKRRMKARVGDLPGHLPGGIADVTSSWPSADEMALDIGVMGQQIAAKLAVEERRIRVTMDLPPMLAMFSGMIASAVRRTGEQLLLPGDKR